MKIPLDVSGVAEAGRIAAALLVLRLQIKAMAEASSTGEPSAYTADRTLYRAFSSGRLRDERDPPGRFEGTFEELVAKTLEAVQAYRDEIAGPVDLVWRTLPEHSVETWKGRAAHNIYLRLAFEPAAVEAQAEPVAALKAVPNIDEPDQTIIRVCQELLGKAMEGELRALAFVQVKRGGYVGTAWHYGTQPSYHQLLSGATRLQHRLQEDGKP